MPDRDDRHGVGLPTGGGGVDDATDVSTLSLVGERRLAAVSMVQAVDLGRAAQIRAGARLEWNHTLGRSLDEVVLPFAALDLREKLDGDVELKAGSKIEVEELEMLVVKEAVEDGSVRTSAVWVLETSQGGLFSFSRRHGIRFKSNSSFPGRHFSHLHVQSSLNSCLIVDCVVITDNADTIVVKVVLFRIGRIRTVVIHIGNAIAVLIR